MANFGNGGAPTSQPPTPAFGSSSVKSGGVFSPTTSQARPHTSLFGTINNPEAWPVPAGGTLFGTPSQPFSGSGNPRGLVIGSPAPVPVPAQAQVHVQGQPKQSSPRMNMFVGPRPSPPVVPIMPAAPAAAPPPPPVPVSSSPPISRTSQTPARSNSNRASPSRVSPTRNSPTRDTPVRSSSARTSPARGSQTPSSTSSQSPTKSPATMFGPTTSSGSSQTSVEQEATPRPPKCYMDLKGDLCLEVGHLSAEFIVCSRAMARSSPFWRKLLYGEFAEGKSAQSKDGKTAWVVKLPEDNSAAMGIILNIIHSRFDQVSGYDDFVYTTHLYNLCVLTDKYDMTHILRPWAKGWSRTTHIQCEKLGQSLRSKFCHERLWIAWELGDFVTFDAMSKALLLNSSSSAGNNLRYVGALEPPEIYESIQKARLSMIKALLSRLDAILQGLVQQNKSLCSRYKVSSERGECLASMLGTTIQSLHANGLWPIPQPEAVECSVWDFAAKLQAVQIEGDAGIYHKCSQTVVLKAEIEKTLYSIPELLSEIHWRHLQSQASKSGMPTFELRAH
ncbi:uncharacterized protein GGS22DRAFT_99794 [Annulohypoxylon maeteangense]|uniref:uncharacterized protein n=1 Tax=Annulohypoxylon maeteangense TaxID=1927788 RepID=UPI002008E410|nr:uncharacterized protein GGS22DRAFT_99794 [Annulohypoxylon maeteangense]KAI0880096.1 hypothetical protein GGS22DRAFT_99794 [Annulohypoxylon maeteangense]